MVRYSLPLTVSSLADFVYSSIDVFLILYFIDSRAVGLYGVAYAFSQLIGTFSTAFSYLSSPISSKLESSGQIDQAVNVQRTIARWVTISTVAALVPMGIFASELLGSIYRPVYETAGFTLVILIIGFGIKGILLTHGPLLTALGKSKMTAFNATVSAIVNVILNLTLIPTYGIEGAATATTVSFIILGVLPTIEVWYYTTSTTLSHEVIAPVIVAIPVITLTVPILTRLPKSLPWLLLVSGAFAAIYIAAVIIILGFTREDVMIIRSIEDNYDISLGVFDSILRRFS
jgi:O-antigen/teichoic acid export membrane protein